MRIVHLAAAAAAGALFIAGPAMAATLDVTFRIDVTGANASGFTPFSFLQTWTLSPDGTAVVGAAPLTDALMANEGQNPPTYLASYGVVDGPVGETRDPQHGFGFTELAVSPPHPFSLSLTSISLDQRLAGQAFGPGLLSYLESGAFAFSLTGPDQGQVGEVRHPGELVSRTYAGVAHVVAPQAAAVPEPEAWALMILGFCGVGAVLRLRRGAFT